MKKYNWVVISLFCFISPLFGETSQTNYFDKKIALPHLISIPSHPIQTGISAVKTANLKALQKPSTTHYQNATMVFDYQVGNLYQIYTTPMAVTDLEFGCKETITSIAAGDTLRWQLSKTYSGQGETKHEHLFLKPMATDISNSVVITTNRRTYHLLVRSTPTSFMASVRWNYPDSENNFTIQYDVSEQTTKETLFEDLDISQLDLNYECSMLAGQKPVWFPQAVFNDGHKTYIQFQKNIPTLPSLFIGGKALDNAVVNYRVVENFYVIDHVEGHLQLRREENPSNIIQINHR